MSNNAWEQPARRRLKKAPRGWLAIALALMLLGLASVNIGQTARPLLWTGAQPSNGNATTWTAVKWRAVNWTAVNWTAVN